MKYPTTKGILFALAAGCVLTAFCPSSAEARIGERREQLERRLFDSGGVLYRDDAMEENRRKGMPYLQYLELLPSSSDVRIYFKTADGRRTKPSELEDKQVHSGWDLHVVYVNGQSAIEVYKRSKKMNDFELNQLLVLHGGRSFWRKIDKEEVKEKEEDSVFGYDMVRDDGAVRARKLGGEGIMFFDAQTDMRLAEVNANILQQKAPISVGGF